MNKEKSKSRLLSEKLLYAAMRILNDNGGTLRSIEVENEVEKALTFDEWENYAYPNGGTRWKTNLQFYSINLVKAGFISKKGGRWTLSEEGKEAIMTLGAEEIFKRVETAYINWKKNSVNDVTTEEISNAPNEDAHKPLEDIKAQGDMEIMDYLHTKTPWEFQDMVAAIFRAMGYYIPFVAPKGKDGGIDVIAFSDPLGAKKPIIKAQVKHYSMDNPVSVDVVRCTKAVAKNDTAVVVTSGRFAEPAKTAARQDNVRLIDGYEFCDLWREYYDKMTEEDKAMMPIEPVFFIKRDDL